MPRIPRDFDFETEEEYDRYLPDYGCPHPDEDEEDSEDTLDGDED